MKFTKTVAQALANKTRKSLAERRRNLIDNFVFSDADRQEIFESVENYIAAKKALKTSYDKMAHGLCNFYTCNDESVESIAKRIMGLIAEKEIPTIPSLDDLTDDFLVESMDVNNSEELIAKVEAKYVA